MLKREVREMVKYLVGERKSFKVVFANDQVEVVEYRGYCWVIGGKGYSDEELIEKMVRYQNNERNTNKVKTVVIYELLKKLGKGKSQNDISKICRLVSYFTDGSEQGIYNDAIEGITLTKYHKAEIERVNKILDDLGLEITIKKDIQY